MITIDDILRPFPKGSAALALRVIEQDLTARFHTHIVNDISIECFREKDDYYIYCKVPSEGNPDSNIKVYYDVIFRFIRPSKADEISTTIRNYHIEVFANVPSFMYTFTHVLKEKKAILTTIDDKYYNKKAMNDKAVIRNPMKFSGIDKTVWFTAHYMEKLGLFRKSTFDEKTNDKLNISSVIKSVKTQEEKLSEVERRNQFKHKELINRKREEKYISKKDKPKQDIEKPVSPLKANMHAEMSSGTKANMHTSTKTNMKANMKSSLSTKKK